MAQPQRTHRISDYIHLAHDRSSTIAEQRAKRTRWMLIALVIILVLAGFSVIFHPVSLTWKASTSASTGLVYNVYRAKGSCPGQGVPVKVGTTSKLSYWDSSIKFGTFCYTVRASLNGVESANSNMSEVRIRPTWRH